MVLFKSSIFILLLLHLCCGPLFVTSRAIDDGENNFLNKMISRGKTLIKSLPKFTVKLAGSIKNLIPSPETIFNVSKQTLIGLPQEVIAYAVHSVCSAAVHVNAIKPSFIPNVREMNFEMLTQNNENITIPLFEPERLWNHSKFRQDWDVVLLITGWNSNINETNDALETLYAAYRRRNTNFVVFDTAHFINSLYSWSAFNTEAVGKIIGHALVELANHISLSRIHLIGHSLGAHISGYAGRTFHEITNKTLPRITGLDPARPCFNEGERLSGLQRGDATFVDIIHSNAGILGVKDPIGDVDFFPNGRYPLQPGCWTIICAHSRSYEYYAETVIPGNEYNFLATRCGSYSSFKAGKCFTKSIPMGIRTPITARGNYYLKTNKESPFGYKRNLVRKLAKLIALM